MRRTTCSERIVGTLVTAVSLMWKSRSHLEVIQERDGRKRMKLREKVHSRSLSKRIQYGVPTQRGGSWERRKRNE